jgi:hypothetical protein
VTGPEPDQIYTGPDRFTVDDLDVVRRDRDRHRPAWSHVLGVLGTASEAPFAVGYLDEPFRLVIDISITN